MAVQYLSTNKPSLDTQNRTNKRYKYTQLGITYAQVSNNNDNNEENEDISVKPRPMQTTNQTKNIQDIIEMLKELMKQMNVVTNLITSYVDKIAIHSIS